METSLPLATDSFSYSWLSSDAPNTTILREDCQSFNFDISITNSPSSIAHADELFSGGLIKPVLVDSNPHQTNRPSSSFSSGVVSPRSLEKTHHHCFLRRWKKSTGRTLRSLFTRYVGCSRKSTRVDDIDNKEWQVKCWSTSSQHASPKSITVHPIGALHHHENSIYEAVLHCKKSLENGSFNK